MGLRISLIVAVSVGVAAFIGVAIFALVEWGGGINGARRKAIQNQYPCLQDGDCGSQWGLPQNYVCDPKLKQCRIRSYQDRTCQSDDQCLQITPHCITTPPVLGSGPQCSHQPFTQGDLFGAPDIGIGGCNGSLVKSARWNFCQSDVGGPCKTTDECAYGACMNGQCTLLGPFAVCTDLGSYGSNQCGKPNTCAFNPKKPLSATHCQPQGIAPGADGSYCLTNADCDNKDCYFITAGDPYGHCAAHVGLVGMACTNASQCAQGLLCNIHTGQTSGTCVLSDTSKTTQLANCPANQYGAVNPNGCIRAVYPVPCSSPSICANQCGSGDPTLLALGFLGPDQSWKPLFGHDTQGILFNGTIFKVGPGGRIYMDPQYTLLVSVSQLAVAARQDYPTITLTPPPAPPPPGVPVQQFISDLKTCQPLVGDDTVLASSFSTEALTNIIFTVQYDPNHAGGPNPAQWGVQAILLNSPAVNGQTTQIQMASNDLYSSFYVNQNVYDPMAPAPNTVYGPCNYYGRASLKQWNIRPIEMGANLPAQWTTWGITNFQLTPPPLLLAGISRSNGYFANCLRFGHDDPTSVEPLDVFVHFLYYPAPGEVVISWKFNVLPTQVAGGLTTLVGLYEVDRDNAMASARVRRLVISTLTLFVMDPGEAGTTAMYSSYDTNYPQMWAYRLKPVFPAANIYASVYSFVLVDFEQSWPFTTKLLGPAVTYSDTAGACTVTFSDSSHANTSVTLPPDDIAVIPGFPGSNRFPVFTPRSYTRIQAASELLTANWTSNLLFGTQAPALLDSDMIVMSTAGRSSIVGLLLNYQQNAPGPNPVPQTLFLTMRFGDTMPTSRYSIPNLTTSLTSFPTRMYTFYLTPETEESGGGDVIGTSFGPTMKAKNAFPSPQVALSPVSTQDISSWVTPPFIPVGDPLQRTVTDGGQGGYVGHQIRTSWGVEVFTGCLIPAALRSPVRFIRMPSPTPLALSQNGGDDLWIWGLELDGSGNLSNMRFVPVFFDNLGIVVANFPGKPAGNSTWISTAATTCPPKPAEIIIAMNRTYNLTDGTTLVFPSWGVDPNVTSITYTPAPNPQFSSGLPLQLVGRMCETQGYQDGILYRARPYVFASSDADESQLFPYAANRLLHLPPLGKVIPDSLQAMALALSSQAVTAPTPQISLPLIGVGSIETLIGAPSFIQPLITNFLQTSPSSGDKKEIIWVGSECGVPMLPGGYKLFACPANPRALTTTVNSPYPMGCHDRGITDRKPMPICIVYRHTSDGSLEMRLYDVRATRSTTNGQYTATIVSDTLVQTNGGLVEMAKQYDPAPLATLAGSAMGFPGFNGGPVIVYSPCQ